MIKLPTWLRAAIISAGQTAAALILVALVDLFLDVQGWIADPTNPIDFSAFGKVVFGAIVTGAMFIVTAIYRKVKPIATSYPDAIDTTATDVDGKAIPAGEVPGTIQLHGGTYQLINKG